MLKRNLLDWLTWCNLDSPTIALFTLERPRTQKLLILNLLVKTWKIAVKPLVFNPDWKGKEDGSGSITLGNEIARETWRQAGRKEKKAFTLDILMYVPKSATHTQGGNAENAWQHHHQDELENEWQQFGDELIIFT